MGKLYAVETAARSVVAFVAALQDHMDTPVIHYDPTGQGEARARKRLAEKRLANNAQARAEDDAPMSRQVRRQLERKAAKARK